MPIWPMKRAVCDGTFGGKLRLFTSTWIHILSIKVSAIEGFREPTNILCSHQLHEQDS